jgi:hypothetical protein
LSDDNARFCYLVIMRFVLLVVYQIDNGFYD